MHQIGHIQRPDLHFDVESFLKFSLSPSQLVLTEVGQDEVEAYFGKLFGKSQPDSISSSCDQHCSLISAIRIPGQETFFIELPLIAEMGGQPSEHSVILLDIPPAQISKIGDSSQKHEILR